MPDSGQSRSRAQRKPKLGSLWDRKLPGRCVHLEKDALLYHAPPRRTCRSPWLGPVGFCESPERYVSRSYQSEHHSHTLPVMSRAPAFPGGYCPTGTGPSCTRPPVLARDASYDSPYAYACLPGPEQARSHSASVGSRFPAALQKASASSQDIPAAGRPSPSNTGRYDGSNAA